VGAGVNWNSPFGPFRIDIAKALTKAEGDDTKLLTFNVGTAFSMNKLLIGSALTVLAAAVRPLLRLSVRLPPPSSLLILTASIASGTACRTALRCFRPR
jgi:hypothetical protein